MSEPAKTPGPVSSAWTTLIERASNLKPRTLAWGGLALAAVILLSVNLISSLTFNGWKGDLTEDGLYSLSDGTRSVLQQMDEPIKLRVYFSSSLEQVAPSAARYFDRLRTLLEKYRDISGGKLELEFLDPEPFSDVEDRAVAAGIRGMRLNPEGENGYFGLVATNSTDDQQGISYFSPDRESFVEYDLTKIIYQLSHPKKRIVGLITSLPVAGGTSPMAGQENQPWLIMDQIRDFFDVLTIEQDVKEIPKNVDVLLVAQPTLLTPTAAYAIDQFVLGGGKVLAFVDPVSEAAHMQLLEKQGDGKAEMAKLLKSWGIDFDSTKAATDIRNARRVQVGRGPSDANKMLTEYVGWLSLDHHSMNESDVLANGIDILNLASAGFLTKADGAQTEMTPVLTTSTDAMVADSKDVNIQADPVALLRKYKPGGKALVLAARVSGEAQSTFPDGPPKPADANKKDEDKKDEKADEAKKDDTKDNKDKPPHLASGRINAIVIADTDLLADHFWVETRQVGGQQVSTPVAHNSAFVVSAIENLSGNDDLIALRGRGVKNRPFTLVETLRRDAEKEFRDKEQALTEKLKTLEQELRTLEGSSQGGVIVLTEAEQKSLENFRNEMVATRGELRNVKLALRRDIDTLDGWLKFANIALVPLLVGLAGIGWSIWQSRKRKSGS